METKVVCTGVSRFSKLFYEKSRNTVGVTAYILFG